MNTGLWSGLQHLQVLGTQSHLEAQVCVPSLSSFPNNARLYVSPGKGISDLNSWSGSKVNHSLQAPYEGRVLQ